MTKLDKFFICYRQSLSQRLVAQMVAQFSDAFEPSAFVYDQKDGSPGTNINDVIDQISHCKLVLVVLGPEWLTYRREGSSRVQLTDPDDWVRKELETLAANPSIDILVVKDEGTPTIRAQNLIDLGLDQALAHRLCAVVAHRVGFSRAHEDILALIQTIRSRGRFQDKKSYPRSGLIYMLASTYPLLFLLQYGIPLFIAVMNVGYLGVIRPNDLTSLEMFARYMEFYNWPASLLVPSLVALLFFGFLVSFARTVVLEQWIDVLLSRWSGWKSLRIDYSSGRIAAARFCLILFGNILLVALPFGLYWVFANYSAGILSFLYFDYMGNALMRVNQFLFFASLAIALSAAAFLRKLDPS